MEDRRSIAKKAAMGVALVIAAAGAVLFYKNNIAMNPGDTLLKYMSYAEDGKYEKMYDLLNEESQKSISKEEFIKRNKNIYKGIGVQTIDADVTSKKRSTTVTYHVKMQTNAGIITYNNRTDFVKENHRYRIDWDDSVIFPQLGAEDKVRVKTLYAKRGRIKDAQGNALAVQGKIYSVGFVPGKMDGNSVKLAAKKLGLSKEEIQKKLDQKWVTDDSFVPLIKLKEYSKDLLNVKGIIVSTETGRIYPLGEAAAHLIGYMQNGEGKAALKIGKDTLKDQLDNLGFGESLKFTFGLNASSYGSEGFTSDIQLADSGYGQGKMMVNPVHMAAIYTALSNNGNMLKPYLVKENGSKKQVLKETIFTKQAVNTVNEAMRQVIRDPSGTGHAANIEGVDLRGKTGTAEIKQSQTDTKGTEIGWFVTIMPATNNREALELVSMAENVKKRGGSGYVVNKTKKIMEEYLQ